MTREEIEATEYARALKVQEESNLVSSGTYNEAIEIIAEQTPVCIIDYDGGVEIYRESDAFCLEILNSIEDAIKWCESFQLPIESVDGEPYMLERDILAELTN